MDEGDRPERNGDPAERSEDPDDDGIERDGVESAEPDGAPEPDDASEASEPGDASEAPEPDDESESIGPTETVERNGRDGFPDEDYPKREGRVPGPAEGDAKESESLIYRFRHDKEGALMWIREMLSSVAIVLVVGLILFGISGVWPPMVAVESGSMEPNMEVGDLVFVTEPGRLAPDAANNDVGVVTYDDGRAADYRTFGSYGSVVIYRPPGRTASPIIHRAMFHVEEGENWYDRADDEYHGAAGCADLRHCPAPHDGFITLGDNNGAYDQANGLAPPVRAEWVTGVARVRVPYLGYVRLIASGQAEPSDILATTVAAESGVIRVVGERGPGDAFDAGGEREPVGWPAVSAFSRWSLRPQGATEA